MSLPIPIEGFLRMRRFLLMAMLVLTHPAAGASAPPASADPAVRFEAANRLTAEGHFEEGAAAYDALASDGRTSAALEYNRSQARLKTGQLGPAWAHLLLAQRLDPRDSAIRFAVDQLAGRVPSGGASISGPGRWLGWMSLTEWAVLALVSLWILGGLRMVCLLSPDWRPRLRNPSWIAGGAAALFSLLLALALAGRMRGPNAVVLRPETSVRVSPLEEARTAFSLPAASELRRRGVRGDWVLVEEPVSRRFGWVKRAEVFLLPLR